ncbi:MAG: N-acetylmuramoyl-L-alanine amidase [Bryobacteraceae bacterium]
MQLFDRQTIIDWRARSIQDPVERLKFLRGHTGTGWRERRGSFLPGLKWLAPALALGLTGVLVSGYEHTRPETMPISRSVILPPVIPLQQAMGETAVWLVDRKGDVETYSNGLRVENRFAVNSQPREGYRVYPRDNTSSAMAQTMNAPAGIVFHTTESDEVPFQADQDRNLKRIGLSVLLFVQQNRSYHFVIDRFGRVFRIVREEDVAKHAGNSIWADDERVYVGLNTSFLGIAMETQSKAGQDSAAANGAQIYAARVLTQMLRSKYHIAAANCVTHAQVSVNPANWLIGYHTDWAANFPFLELGLRDNYLQPPASIVVFGFGYDPLYLQSTGERLLPGLLNAENQVRAQASRLGLPVERYKALLQAKYLHLIASSRPDKGSKEKEEQQNGS